VHSAVSHNAHITELASLSAAGAGPACVDLQKWEVDAAETGCRHLLQHVLRLPLYKLWWCRLDASHTDASRLTFPGRRPGSCLQVCGACKSPCFIGPGQCFVLELLLLTVWHCKHLLLSHIIPQGLRSVAVAAIATTPCGLSPVPLWKPQRHYASLTITNSLSYVSRTSTPRT
jgi:hypothetical protein